MDGWAAWARFADVGGRIGKPHLTPHSIPLHETTHRRVFLYPVFRDKGYMTLISQYQDTCFLLTFLEDFRKNPQVGACVELGWVKRARKGGLKGGGPVVLSVRVGGVVSRSLDA